MDAINAADGVRTICRVGVVEMSIADENRGNADMKQM